MTQLTTTNRVCEHLEKYVYDRIWNEPYSEYRVHTKMCLLNTYKVNETTYKCRGPVAGYYAGRYSSIALPSVKSVFVLTSDTTFSSNKRYYLKNGTRYTQAEVVAGEDIPANTYYEWERDTTDWLATTGPKYYLFSIGAKFFKDVRLNVHEWTLLSDYCNEHLVDLRVYASSGDATNRSELRLNRGFIYIKQSDMRDCLLVAVDSVMMSIVFGDVDAVSNGTFYLEHYFDSHLASTGTPTRWITAGRLGTDVIDTDLSHYEDNAEVYYNGKLCLNADTTKFKSSNYLEIVTGNDYESELTILVNSDNVYTHHYNENKVEKTSDRVLVHIDKDLNPNNYIITPNTCDLFLQPVTSTTITTDYCVSLCMAGRSAQIFQITHNDFSIDKSTLDQIAAKQGWTAGYKLIVLIRRFEKNRTPVRDANYIDQLYNLTDDEIDACLRGIYQDGYVETTVYQPSTEYFSYNSTSRTYQSLGRLSEEEFNTQKSSGVVYRKSLSFWMADYLEDCKYADALTRRRNVVWNMPTRQDSAIVQNQCKTCGNYADCTLVDKSTTPPTYVTDHQCPYYSVRSMQDYVDILGYFHVMALIGRRVFHYQVTETGTHEINLFAPMALTYPELSAEDYFPIVYHNGTRIDQSKISVSSTTDDNSGLTELHHEDEYTTSVIQLNYGTKLKINIDLGYYVTKSDTFNSEKTYYKYVHHVATKPDRTFTKTTDTEFQSGKKYYYRGTDDYIIGVVGQHYNIGDTVSESIYGDWYHIDAEVIAEEWDQYELAHGCSAEDYAKMPDYEKRAIDYIYNTLVSEKSITFYNATEDILSGDYLVVELFENRNDGQFKYWTRTAGEAPCYLQMSTEDQWNLYQCSTVTRPDGVTGLSYTLLDKSTVGTFDTTTKILDTARSLDGKQLALVEGPLTIEDVKNVTINSSSTGYIGNDFWSTSTSGTPVFPLDTQIVFLNDKRLIDELDVHAFVSATAGTVYGANLYIQNLSYLRESNTVNIIRTNATKIDREYGFIVGGTVTYKGQAPLWFDELSTLTIAGKVVSTYTYNMGAMTITGDYRNGAPYELTTLVSSRIKDIVGCSASMTQDLERIKEIQDFFKEYTDYVVQQSIIPHSHKIYSTYLEAIVSEYLDPDSSFTFYRVGQGGITEATFENQFSAWASLKTHDIVYKISDHTRKFVDVYLQTHRTAATNTVIYNNLLYLMNKLLPSDTIKHKDAPNDR